jgi:hypothetical protein
MNFVRLKHEIEEVKEKTKSFAEFCSQIGGEISEKVKETVGDLFCNVDADNLKGTLPDVFATMISTDWKEPNDLILKIVHGYHDGGKETYSALSLRHGHNDAYYIGISYGDVFKVRWSLAESIKKHKVVGIGHLDVFGKGEAEAIGPDEAISVVKTGVVGKRKDFPETWDGWNGLWTAIYRDVEWPLQEELNEELAKKEKLNKLEKEYV